MAIKEKTRSIRSVPEGGCSFDDLFKYGVKDEPEASKAWCKDCPREWSVTYRKNGEYKDSIFIVHAMTLEGAFSHFISIRPDTRVMAIEFMNIYI